MAEERIISRVCPNCGRVLEETWRSCPYCSKDLSVSEKPKAKSRIGTAIAGIVCVALGLFIFGIIFGFIAVVCGILAMRGSAASKVLGALAIIGGIIEILLVLFNLALVL